MTEADIRDMLLESLRGVVRPPFAIGKEVPVPYKHIYIPPIRRGCRPRLEVWCFKQDIVVYRPLLDKSVGHRQACIAKAGLPLVDVVLEKDNAQNTHDVGLPYVIIEVKKQTPNSHEVLAYSQKAQMIKTIFPYCAFLFLVVGRIAARTYRHGVGFDRVLALKDMTDVRGVRDLRREVSASARQAQALVNRLSPNL